MPTHPTPLSVGDLLQLIEARGLSAAARIEVRAQLSDGSWSENLSSFVFAEFGADGQERLLVEVVIHD